MGAISANSTESELQSLADFAHLLGNAYQIRDNLLDQEEDAQVFNSNGTSALNNSEANSLSKLNEMLEKAKKLLISNFHPSESRTCLLQFTDYLCDI